MLTSCTPYTKTPTIIMQQIPTNFLSNLSVANLTSVTTSQGINYITNSSVPNCDSSIRGKTWYIPSALGVADIFQVCTKTVLDTYVWKVVTLT